MQYIQVVQKAIHLPHILRPPGHGSSTSPSGMPLPEPSLNVRLKFDVLAEQSGASIFIDGKAGHAVNVLDVGNMQLADFFDAHTGIKRNPRCPELGRLSFRSLQITGSVTEKGVQFVVRESGSPGSFTADILVGHGGGKPEEILTIWLISCL